MPGARSRAAAIRQTYSTRWSTNQIQITFIAEEQSRSTSSISTLAAGHPTGDAGPRAATVNHQPGQFRNVVRQNRARVPDGFETALVAALKRFRSAREELEQIVSALNQRRLFDRSGQPWNEATFA